MKTLSLICIVLYFSTSIIHAQNRTLKGRVIDDNLEALPYISILINDTVKVGKTDLNGFFQIDIPISINRLSFSAVGVETATIEMMDKCSELEMVMVLQGTFDFMTRNHMNKIRLKKFRKLPEIYKKAFEKGIFKTKKACYIRDFTRL